MDRKARRALLAVATALAALAGSPGPARPDDGAPDKAKPAAPATTPEERQRLGDLRTRVGEWALAKGRVVIPCANCRGTGKAEVMAGGRIYVKPCSVCQTKGKVVSKETCRKVFFEMMSPAWQALAASPAEATEKMKALDVTQAGTYLWKSYNIERLDLVGPTHATARVMVDFGRERLREPQESRWVYATDPKTRLTKWYLWREEADGPWPDAAEPTAAAPGAAPGKADTLPPLADAQARGIIEKTKPAYTVRTLSKEGTTLVVVLEYPQAQTKSGLDFPVTLDSILVFRALFGALSEWDGIRLEFLADWIDRFGAVQQKPHAIVSLDRPTFKKIVFENLTHEKTFALFQTVRPEYSGFERKLQ